MAVRIRMKKLGRRHRPFYRICAVDGRAPRDGRVLEELGTYDPIIPDVDARAQLNGERIKYWLGVGAQPSDKVKVLIKKYGSRGTHLPQQEVALDRLAQARRRPEPLKVEPRAETQTEVAPEERPPVEMVSETVSEEIPAATPETPAESAPEESSQ